jgi:hypothetical protein
MSFFGFDTTLPPENDSGDGGLGSRIDEMMESKLAAGIDGEEGPLLLDEDDQDGLNDETFGDSSVPTGLLHSPPS